MRSTGDSLPEIAGRRISERACSITKGEFIANKACCGTVVCGRRSADWSGFAKSNDRKKPRQVGPIDKSINRTATALGVVGHVDRSAEQRGIEPCRDRQHRVAHRLHVEPLTIGMPQQPILGIDLSAGGPVGTRLLIGVREQDAAMELLDRPAVVHECRGEVIEQFGMRRRCRADSKVAWRLDERLAEVVHPDAVDEDTARERVIAGGDGPGQIESAAPVRKGPLMIARQHAEELSRHVLSRLRRIAANKDAGIAEPRRVGQNHGPRQRGGRIDRHTVERRLQLVVLVPSRRATYRGRRCSSGTRQGPPASSTRRAVASVRHQAAVRTGRRSTETRLRKLWQRRPCS